MSQENLEIVRAVYNEWGRGNFRAGADFYDPLVLFVPHPNQPEASHRLGTDGLSEYWREFLDAWTDLTIVAVEFIEADNSVVVAEHLRGTGQGSGVPVELRHFAVWTFRGRAVIRFELFRDRDTALAAVGL